MRPAARAEAAAAGGGSAPLPPLLTDWLPISILTDSYKTTHYLQYPQCTKMVAVSGFRSHGWRLFLLLPGGFRPCTHPTAAP